MYRMYEDSDLSRATAFSHVQTTTLWKRGEKNPLTSFGAIVNYSDSCNRAHAEVVEGVCKEFF